MQLNAFFIEYKFWRDYIYLNTDNFYTEFDYTFFQYEIKRLIVHIKSLQNQISLIIKPLFDFALYRYFRKIIIEDIYEMYDDKTFSFGAAKIAE